MNIRSRHIAMMLYGAFGFTALIQYPDIFNSIESIMAVMTPLIGMFTWDKVDAMRVGASNKST